MKLVEKKDVTPNNDVVDDESDLVPLAREKKIRSRFKFSMIGIAPESILRFIKDENITATAVDDFG